MFAISDNGISISLKDRGWLHELYNRVAMKKFIADGADPLDVHAKSEAALHYSRTYRRPSMLVRLFSSSFVSLPFSLLRPSVSEGTLIYVSLPFFGLSDLIF